MSNRPPYETFTKPTCRGSYALGTACGKCEKCEWENTHRLDKSANNFGLQPPEEKICRDDPDTHVWSNDQKPFANGRGMTKYCVVCGTTAIAHALRIGL